MIQFVSVTFIIAMAACWLILLSDKTGIRDNVIIHAPKLISQMFSCDLCLSWWVCLFFSICFSVGMGDPVILLTAVCAAPFTRFYLA